MSVFDLAPTAAPAAPQTITLVQPFARVTWLDCVVCGLAAGVIAAVAFNAGAKYAAPAPVTKREYLTQQVWAPQCGPGYRGLTVDERPAPPLFDHYATAETGDGRETRRQGDTFYVRNGRKSPYERARDAAEAKYYRDMFKPSKGDK